MKVSFATIVLVLSAVCFAGLFWMERHVANWGWLLPMGLFLLVLSMLLGAASFRIGGSRQT